MAETPKEYDTNYPSDVSDREQEFCAPCLTLMDPEAPQRQHSLRALFNGLRYLVKTDVQWRYLPADFPPSHTVCQQARRCGKRIGVMKE